MVPSILSRLNPLRVLRERPAILSAIACLLMGLALGSMFTRQALRTDTPDLIQPGQTLAQQIVGAALQADGVGFASGAYLPGDGIVLYSQVEYGDRALIRAWAANQLIPFADRLSQLPKAEQLTWIIDFPPAGQEIVQSPLQKAADSATHRYISAANRLVVAQPTALPILPTTVQPVAELSVAATAVPQPVIIPPTALPAVVVVPVVPVAPTIAAMPTPTMVVVAASTFDTNSENWSALSGRWAVTDGSYVQSDQEGYDYIAILDTPPLEYYQLSMRLRINAGEMGGGFVYNIPDPTKRDGAQLVDFTNQGRVLRWGHYQEGGAFQFDGSLIVEPAIMDGNWHVLVIVTQADTTQVVLDGKVLTTITNQSKSGRIGLTSSRAWVSFDDVQVVSLEPIQ